jgi:hypothetical protein
VSSLVRSGKYATVGLCRGDEPYVVTLSFGLDAAANRLYFHCANEGEKLDFIAANPRACATVIKDSGYLDGRCDHDYASVVIRGKMRIVRDLEEKKHGLLVMLDHLEKDPAPILARNIKNDASYDTVTILSLDVESMIGKKHIE